MLSPKFNLGSEPLHHWILLFERIYLSIAKEVSNNEVGAAQQERGMCYRTLWKAQGGLFSPLVMPVQLWEETCPSGASDSCPSLPVQCWGPHAGAAAGLGHGAVQRLALAGPG